LLPQFASVDGRVLAHSLLALGGLSRFELLSIDTVENVTHADALISANAVCRVDQIAFLDRCESLLFFTLAAGLLTLL